MKLENTERLMDRPDFEDAVRGSASWVTEALHTISRLEEAPAAINRTKTKRPFMRWVTTSTHSTFFPWSALASLTKAAKVQVQ